MEASALSIVAWCLIGLGCVFVLCGALGLLRLPDVFTRMHAAGLVDTLGAGLVLVGLAMHAGFGLAAAKLILLLAILWLTSPTAGHALAKAALRSGVVPVGTVDEQQSARRERAEGA